MAAYQAARLVKGTMGRDSDTAYLDYNATSPVLAEVADAVAESISAFGNPSSVHGLGRRARAAVETAREEVAASLSVPVSGVVFTSGGTEANALALRSLAATAGCEAVLASAIEHPSVLAHVPNDNLIPVHENGIVDVSALEEMLQARAGPVLVAVMLANNETGVVQPVAEIVKLAKTYGALVHTDAVQAFGKIDVNFADLGVDSMSLSAHKLGGLKGTGALILRDGLSIEADLPGGGQERSRRAGTENVTGIVAFGTAAGRAGDLRRDCERVRRLRDRLEAKILAAAPQARIFGRETERLDNTCCVAISGVPSETQLMRLDLAGIAVSAGSACSSGKISPSHVLQAMGVAPEIAKCAIRISMGWKSTQADVDRFLDVWTPLALNNAA